MNKRDKEIWDEILKQKRGLIITYRKQLLKDIAEEEMSEFEEDNRTRFPLYDDSDILTMSKEIIDTHFSAMYHLRVENLKLLQNIKDSFKNDYYYNYNVLNSVQEFHNDILDSITKFVCDINLQYDKISHFIHEYQEDNDTAYVEEDKDIKLNDRFF